MGLARNANTHPLHIACRQAIDAFYGVAFCTRFLLTGSRPRCILHQERRCLLGRLLVIGVVALTAVAVTNFIVRRVGEPGGILDRIWFPIP